MYRKATITILALLIAMVAPLSAASTPATSNSNKIPSAKTHEKVEINKTQTPDHKISNQKLTSNQDSSEDDNEKEEEKKEELERLSETKRDSTGEDNDDNTDDDDEVITYPTMGHPSLASSNINNNKDKRQQNIAQDIMIAIIVGVFIFFLFTIIINYLYPKTSLSSTEPTTPMARQAPDKAKRETNVTSVSIQKPTATPATQTTSTLKPVQDDDNTLKSFISFIWFLLCILLVGLWAFRKYDKTKAN